MTHFKIQNISEDFKGNIYPTLSDLLDMVWNFIPYKKPNGDIYQILPMTYIRCCVCKSYKYLNRYGRLCYNRSVVCVKCRGVNVGERDVLEIDERFVLLSPRKDKVKMLQFCYKCVKGFRTNQKNCSICNSPLEEIESIRFKAPRKKRLTEYV